MPPAISRQSLPSVKPTHYKHRDNPRQTAQVSHSRGLTLLSGRKQNSTILHSLHAVAEDGTPAEMSASEDMFEDVNVKVKGALWDGYIKRYNKGGVVVKAGPSIGFCPYSKMDAIRVADVIANRKTEIDGSSLLRQPIKCLVHAIEDEGRTILSELAYLTAKAVDFYKPGDIVKCIVTGIQGFGVFVSVPSEDGQYHGVFGFVHVSELSWDVVTRPESVVQIGDEVTAFVKNVKRHSNQIELSLRHDSLDPLKESISSLLPPNGDVYQDVTWEQPENISQELNHIMETLRLEPGIEEVQPARQAEVQHKVSLDLELWLSKEDLEDGFNLVAWSGRTLQEIHVKTSLTRAEMKDTLRGVLKRTM